MALPLIFEPSFEQPEPDEAETAAALTATLRSISETTLQDYGHPVRPVHAKSHGILQAELRVLHELPEAYAQGAFAHPRSYPVVMRFSTNPGDILDDSISAPRGLGLKIVGVEGARLPGSEGQLTQDFVMANSPAFSTPDPKGFLKSLKLLAKTTDTPQVWKKAFSAVLRGTEVLVEAVGGKSATLISLGGQPLNHVLGNVFYTAVPLLWGPYIAKLSVAPLSPHLQALADVKVATGGKPNALRDAVAEVMAERDGEWEVRVQLCTDLATMPIEDASAVWPEDASRYVPVGRITVPRQPVWSEARAAAFDDGMAFSPWHGLAAHRPLGGIMRVRKPVYEASAAFRGQHNGCPMHEPRSLETMLG